MTMEFKHMISGFAHCDIVMSFEQVGLELASCFLKYKMLLDSIYSELKYIKKRVDHLKIFHPHLVILLEIISFCVDFHVGIVFSKC